MRVALLSLTLITVIFSARGFAQTIADTPENREAQAERYLQATPPKALFDQMFQKMAASMGVNDKEKYIENFEAQLDMDAITQDMKAAIIKHFTAEEIKALADFYGSPVGKSAMSKFGDYMADVMPTIQSEVMKAQAKMTQTPAASTGP